MRALIMLIVAVLLPGCSWLTTYNNKESSVGGSDLFFVDAKQRAVIVAHDLKAAAGSKAARFCAEPSPDALSSIAANQGLNFSREGKSDLGVNFGLAEAAGFIGLRTQSIQLMRDALYRLCEAYVSGAISDEAYETMNRRFQSSMVAIAAIEQLTGAIAAPSIVLTGKTESTVGEKFVEVTDKVIKAREDVGKAESAVADATQKKQKADADLKALTDRQAAIEKDPLITSSTPPADDATKKKVDALKAELAEIKDKKIPEAKKVAADQKTALEGSEKALKDRKEAVALLERAQSQLSASGLAASTDAKLGTVPSRDIDPATIEKIAGHVEKIALETINKPFTNELCTTVLLAGSLDQSIYSDDAKQRRQGLLETCMDYLVASVTTEKTLAAFIKEQEKAINAAPAAELREKTVERVKEEVRRLRAGTLKNTEPTE